MHRPVLATLLAVGALASSAKSACLDTLFLKRITAYSASFRVGDPASSVLFQARNVPFDSLEVVGPIVPHPIQHVLQFSTSCTPDSLLATARFGTVYDTTIQDGIQERYVVTSNIRDSAAMVEFQKNVILGGLEHTNPYAFLFTIEWPRPVRDPRDVHTLSVGAPSGSSLFLTYSLEQHMAMYTGNANVLNWNTRVADSRPDSATVFHLATSADRFASADSVGSGKKYDSARVVSQIFAYEYGFTPPPTGIIPQKVLRASGTSSVVVSLHSDGQWGIFASRPGAISIRTLNGRLVRELPAGNSVVWDGLDRAGRPVQAGVYLVEVRGVGHSRIPLAR